MTIIRDRAALDEALAQILAMAVVKKLRGEFFTPDDQDDRQADHEQHTETVTPASPFSTGRHVVHKLGVR